MTPDVRKIVNFIAVINLITATSAQHSANQRSVLQFQPTSRFNTDFHLLTELYDHYAWNINIISQTANISESCRKDMNAYLDDLSKSETWALKAYDSSGRYRGQQLFGNEFWLGSKRFCEDIHNQNTKDKEPAPAIRFFVAKVWVKLDPTEDKAKLMQIGQCLPTACSVSAIQSFLEADPVANVLKFSKAKPNNELSVQDVRKVPGDYDAWSDKKLYIFCFVTMFFVVLMIFATFYERSLQSCGYKYVGGIMMRASLNRNDEMRNNNNNLSDTEVPLKSNSNEKLSLLSNIILCFAFGSNAKEILSVQKLPQESVTCIHGMRVFTFMWIVMVHTCYFLYSVGENKFIRNLEERDFIYQMVGNASFSVDTFFFIGGLLLVLIFLRGERKKQARNQTTLPKGNVWFFRDSFKNTLLLVLHRFLRLTPAYMFVLVLSELWMKSIYNSSVFSLWQMLDNAIPENCNKYWWRNFLYINNLTEIKEMCIGWTWYLANDMQFYIFAVVLLLISRRYFKFSAISTITVLLSALVTSIMISLHYKFRYKVADPFETFGVLYDKPWTRISPYIMGMLTGYILFRVKKAPNISRSINLLLWFVSIGIMFLLVFGVWDGELNILMTSFYVSLGHSAWGFALIWVCLSCYWGISGPVDSILSYKGYYPMSRLVYCAYLIHPTIMLSTALQLEAPIQLQRPIYFTMSFGNTGIAFVFAFFISILFERPAIRLLKILL